MKYKYFEEYKKANKDIYTEVGYVKWLESQLKAERNENEGLKVQIRALQDAINELQASTPPP